MDVSALAAQSDTLFGLCSAQWALPSHRLLRVTCDVRRLLPPDAVAGSIGVSFDQPLREARESFERLYFEHHLRLEGGNMTRLAEKTGLERTHLYRKLKQLGLQAGRRHEENQ